MRSYLVTSLAIVALLGAGGCVPQSKYATAAEEADAAKAELGRAEAQRASLDQQVKTLKELNDKLSQEAQLAKDELQRLEHGRDTERASLEERTKELEKQIRTLAAQHRVIRRQYQKVTQRNKALQSTVARYQKELKERRRGASQATLPPSSKPPEMGGATAQTGAGALPASGSQGAPARAGAAMGKATRVNLNTASVNDIVLQLGLTRDDASRVVSNRPYRIRGELVAKNVLPKDTFDKIYDRITVRQP